MWNSGQQLRLETAAKIFGEAWEVVEAAAKVLAEAFADINEAENGIQRAQKALHVIECKRGCRTLTPQHPSFHIPAQFQRRFTRHNRN